MSALGRLWTRVWQRRLGGTWDHWRRSGTLLMVGWAAFCLLVALIGLRQSYPLAAPALAWCPPVAAALCAGGWLWASLRSRPGWSVGALEPLLLTSPQQPWRVLLPALTLALLPPLAWATGMTALGALWWPQWWGLWSALPLIALPLITLSGQLLWIAAHDWRCARLDSPGQARWPATWPALGALLGLLWLAHPLLGVLGCLGVGATSFWVWRSVWSETSSPRLLARLQHQGLRQGARRLGLSLPDLDADGLPRRSVWRPRVWSGRVPGPGGAFRAACWYGALRLGQRPARLLWAVLAGLGAGALAPGSPLPLVYLLGLVLGLGLDLLAPPLPAAAPLSPLGRALARSLPPGVALGAALLLGGGLGWALGWVGPLTLLALPLLPWSALCTLLWLGEALPGSPVGGATLRYGAASLSALLAFGAAQLSPWAAPAALLLLGSGVLWSSSGRLINLQA